MIRGWRVKEKGLRVVLKEFRLTRPGVNRYGTPVRFYPGG